MAPKTIVLKGNPRKDEKIAAGTITPGHLIQMDADDKVVVHAVEGGDAELSFAIEDALQGRPITTDYTSGERVFIARCKPGDEIYAWLKLDEIAVVNSILVSGGDGTLILIDSTTTATHSHKVLARALEALDLSPTAAVVSRIKVRVE